MRGNDLAMMYVMFVKPSAAESLVVVTAAGLGCLAVEWALARRVSPVETTVLAS